MEDSNSNFRPINISNVNTNKILLDFEVIVDLDIASVRFFIDNCKNDDILNTNIGLINTLSGIRNVMLFRRINNPLAVCIKEEYYEDIDSLYSDLINKYEKEILDLSRPNDLFNYFYMLNCTNNLANITINCKSENQIEFIKSKFDNAKVVLNERNLENYDTLYLKYASDIVQYTNIINKKIYLINGMYNFDAGLFKPAILLIVDQNIVNTIDPYKDLTIPALYTIINFKEE